MKAKNLLAVILYLITQTNIVGQKDTVLIESSTESVESFDGSDDYTYLEQALRKEKSIIKVGLSPYSYPGSGNGIFYPVSISYERKISEQFSVGLNCSYYFKRMYYSYYDGEPILNITPSFKYYYQMKRKIKAGKSANNFHGNYFALKIDGIFKVSDKHYLTIYPNNDTFSERKRKLTSEPFISLEWGIQRRIWKSGYFNVGPFVNFNHETARVGARLSIGLGFGFKK